MQSNSCPNCFGSLSIYDSSLVCDYCDSVFYNALVEQYDDPNQPYDISELLVLDHYEDYADIKIPSNFNLTSFKLIPINVFTYLTIDIHYLYQYKDKLDYSGDTTFNFKITSPVDFIRIYSNDLVHSKILVAYYLSGTLKTNTLFVYNYQTKSFVTLD